MPPEPAARVSSLRDLADFIADNAHRIPISYEQGRRVFLKDLPTPAALKTMARLVSRGAVPPIVEDHHAAP
jgi:hypothetical protein